MYENELQSELWRLIGLKLYGSDRIRFRAVSKLFRSLIPQPPWLMLAQSEEGRESDSEAEDEDQAEHEELEQGHSSPVVVLDPPRRGFVSLGEQHVFEIDSPQLHLAQCVGSTGNWLITTHKDKTIRLLNPFSTQQFYLPPQSAFEHNIYHIPNEKFRHLHLWKIILSSPPSTSKSKDCIAMAIHNYRQTLAIARLGDANWTTVRNDHDPSISFIEDVVFYKGLFYAIITNGVLVVCHIGDDGGAPTSTFLTAPFRVHSQSESSYLVEWLGELLMVIRFVDQLDNDLKYTTNTFKLYKFDFSHNKWNDLNSLGEHSLFLGFNASVSLRASDYSGSLKKNCIYFTDNFMIGFRGYGIPGGRDMGVFDLEDNTITPHFRGVSTCLYSPPVWIVPT